jgi:hypothetical protein
MRHLLHRTFAVLLLVVTTLAALTVAAVAAAAPAPELLPPPGQPGTKTTDVVTFGGTVDPSATIVSGFLVFTDAAGAEVGARLDTMDRDARPERKLRKDADGNLQGSFQLAPGVVDAAATGVALEVTVRQDGGQVTARSNVVEVDQIRPFIEAYGVISPTEIAVFFNEVVTYPRPVQDPTAWLVDGERGLVAAVEGGTSAQRVLRLRSPLGEDATPIVAFFPAQGTASPTYFDLNGWSLDPNQARREAQAKDLIPPVVPTITEIAGKVADGVVLGNEPQPTLRVEDVTDGHRVLVFLDTDGDGRFSDGPGGDTQVGSGTASGGAVEITIDRTLADGRHVFHAVAEDVNGNRSEGADTAEYDLDTVVPVLADDAQVDGTTIVVSFSEPVSGTNRAGDWTITFPDGDSRTAQVTGVSGSGASRSLTADTDDLAGARVTYTPTAAPLSDPHGNALEGSSALPTEIPPVPLPIVTIDDTTVQEGPPFRVASFVVTVSRPLDEDLTVDLGTAARTADESSTAAIGFDGQGLQAACLDGTDYAPPATESVTIPRGQTSTQVRVLVCDDDLDEFDETFDVELLRVRGDVAQLALSQAARTGVGTIVDDDAPSLVGVGPASILRTAGLGDPHDVTVEEGAVAVVPIELDRTSGKDVVVTYEVRSDTAVVGADIEAARGQVRIPAGQERVEVRVATIDDDLDEPDEQALFVLTSTVNADLDPDRATGTITILDDDPAVIIDIDPSSLTRDGDVLRIPVRLREPSGKTVAVSFATEDRTATAGEDYEATAGDLTFRPGETATTVSVTLLPEGRDRTESETFAVVLSEPRNAFLGTDEAVLRLGAVEAAGDGDGGGGGDGATGGAPGGGGTVLPGVDPGAVGPDLPRTGGGLAALGLLGMLGAGAVRRRR